MEDQVKGCAVEKVQSEAHKFKEDKKALENTVEGERFKACDVEK